MMMLVKSSRQTTSVFAIINMVKNVKAIVYCNPLNGTLQEEKIDRVL
jgi:hypothetical protein